MPPTTQLDPNAPPPMLVKAAQSMAPLFAQPVSAAEHAISDAAPPPNSGPTFGPQIDPVDQMSAELKSGESKPPDPLEVSGDAAAQQGGQDKNLTDAIDRGAADAQRDKPVLAEQGPSNPILHFLSRITGRTGPQPSPGEKYEGPTTDKEKNAAVPKFLSSIGNAMVSIGGRPQEQEFEQKRPMMQREQDLELAKLNNTLHYQEGMIDTRQEQNRIREQRAVGDLSKHGMTVDEATGQVRPMAEQEITDNPVLNQDMEVRKNTSILKRAQAQKAIADRDVLMNPDNPTFRQRQQHIDAQIALAKQGLNLRLQSLGIAAAGLNMREQEFETNYPMDESGRRQHITSQTRFRSETAQMIEPHITAIEAEINRLGKIGKLGPVAGRIEEVLTGRIGMSDPDYAGLRTQFGLMQSGIGMMHGGARAAGSIQMIQYMKDTIRLAASAPENAIAVLESAKQWVDTYAAGPGKVFQQPQGNGGRPAASAQPNAALAAPGGKWNPVKRRWE